MQTIQLDYYEACGQQKKGRFLKPSDVDRIFESEVTLLTPAGQLLAILCKRAIPEDVTRAGYEGLRTAAAETTNRGYAAGTHEASVSATAVRGVGVRTRKIKEDGTLSNTNDAPAVFSGVAGAMDRYPRIPYCRQTAWTADHPERWQAALPYIQCVAGVMQAHCPEQYAAQLAVCQRTEPEWVIPGTPFTTITVNRNFQTAVHTDRGDYKPGIGVMTCFKRGQFGGMQFVFPEYRVGFNFGDGDVLLADVHQWHGNLPMIGNPMAVERISCVFYYREKMKACGNHEQELERAKAARSV